MFATLVDFIFPLLLNGLLNGHPSLFEAGSPFQAVGVRMRGCICDCGSNRPLASEHVNLTNRRRGNKTTPREPIIAIHRETAWQRGVPAVRSGVWPLLGLWPIAAMPTRR